MTMRQAELSLEQMLSDVIVQLVMRRDGVTEAEVRELIASVARQRAAFDRDGRYDLPVAA
jgi:hypothetical protein